jgi:probable F420-dependent oxidoreductase
VEFRVKIPGTTLYTDARGFLDWEVNVTTEQIVAVAQAADELGIDYLSISTHFVMDRQIARTMGPRWAHSLSAAAFVLGATKRIKLICLVVVPNHNPVELAKALATIDWISGGRLIVVPLVGYQPWEFEIVNAPFDERGSMMDEYMDAMIELWTAADPRFAGKYVQFQDIVFDPKPRQNPLPLWFGGRTKAALRRLARLGHGWMSTTTAHAEMPKMLEYIRAQPGFEAHPRRLQIYASIGERKMIDFQTHEFSDAPEIFRTHDQIIDQISYLTGQGVTLTQAPLEGGSPEGDTATSIDDYIRRLEWFATEIMPDARRI